MWEMAKNLPYWCEKVGLRMEINYSAKEANSRHRFLLKKNQNSHSRSQSKNNVPKSAILKMAKYDLKITKTFKCKIS